MLPCIHKNENVRFRRHSLTNNADTWLRERKSCNAEYTIEQWKKYQGLRQISLAYIMNFLHSQLDTKVPKHRNTTRRLMRNGAILRWRVPLFQRKKEHRRKSFAGQRYWCCRTGSRKPKSLAPWRTGTSERWKEPERMMAFVVAVTQCHFRIQWEKEAFLSRRRLLEIQVEEEQRSRKNTLTLIRLRFIVRQIDYLPFWHF